MKIQKLYDNLSSDGYNLGDINQFQEQLADENKRKKFYDNLASDGYNLGDYESFTQQVSPPPVEEDKGILDSIGGVIDSVKDSASNFIKKRRLKKPKSLTPDSVQNNLPIPEKPPVTHSVGSWLNKYAPSIDSSGQDNNQSNYLEVINQVTGANPETPLSEVNIDSLAEAVARQEGFYNSPEQNMEINGRAGNLSQDFNNVGMLEFREQEGATPSPEVKDAKGNVLYPEGRFAVFSSPEQGFEALKNQLRLDQSTIFPDPDEDNLTIAVKIARNNSLPDGHPQKRDALEILKNSKRKIQELRDKKILESDNIAEAIQEDTRVNSQIDSSKVSPQIKEEAKKQYYQGSSTYYGGGFSRKKKDKKPQYDYTIDDFSKANEIKDLETDLDKKLKEYSSLEAKGKMDDSMLKVTDRLKDPQYLQDQKIKRNFFTGKPVSPEGRIKAFKDKIRDDAIQSTNDTRFDLSRLGKRINDDVKKLEDLNDPQNNIARTERPKAIDPQVIEQLDQRGSVIDGHYFYDMVNQELITDPEQAQELENPKEPFNDRFKRPAQFLKIDAETHEVSDEDKLTVGDVFTEPRDLLKTLPFVGGLDEFAVAGKITKIAIDLEKGNEVSDEDLIFMRDFNDRIQRETSLGNMTTAGVSQLFAFIIELGTTKGVYTGTKKLAQEGSKTALKNLFKKKGQSLLNKQLALRGAMWGGRTLGVMTQTLIARAGSIGAGYLNNKRGSINVQEKFDKNRNKVLIGSYDPTGEESSGKAFFKSYGDNLIELISERSGYYISKLGGKAKNKIFKDAIEKSVKKTNPKVPEDVFNKFLKEAGIGGFAEEWSEERVGQVLRALTGIEELKMPTQDEFLSELMVLAVPQGAKAGLKYAYQKPKAQKKQKLEVEDQYNQITALNNFSVNTPEQKLQLQQEKLNEALESNDIEGIHKVLDDVTKDQTALPSSIQSTKTGKGNNVTYRVTIKDQYGDDMLNRQFTSKEVADEYVKETSKKIDEIQKSEGGKADQRLDEIKEQFEEVGYIPFTKVNVTEAPDLKDIDNVEEKDSDGEFEESQQYKETIKEFEERIQNLDDLISKVKNPSEGGKEQLKELQQYKDEAIKDLNNYRTDEDNVKNAEKFYQSKIRQIDNYLKNPSGLENIPVESIEELKDLRSTIVSLLNETKGSIPKKDQLDQQQAEINDRFNYILKDGTTFQADSEEDAKAYQKKVGEINRSKYPRKNPRKNKKTNPPLLDIVSGDGTFKGSQIYKDTIKSFQDRIREIDALLEVAKESDIAELQSMRDQTVGDLNKYQDTQKKPKPFKKKKLIKKQKAPSFEMTDEEYDDVKTTSKITADDFYDIVNKVIDNAPLERRLDQYSSEQMSQLIKDYGDNNNPKIRETYNIVKRGNGILQDSRIHTTDWSEDGSIVTSKTGDLKLTNQKTIDKAKERELISDKKRQEKLEKNPRYIARKKADKIVELKAKTPQEGLDIKLEKKPILYRKIKDVNSYDKFLEWVDKADFGIAKQTQAHTVKLINSIDKNILPKIWDRIEESRSKSDGSKGELDNIISEKLIDRLTTRIAVLVKTKYWLDKGKGKFNQERLDEDLLVLENLLTGDVNKARNIHTGKIETPEEIVETPEDVVETPTKPINKETSDVKIYNVPINKLNVDLGLFQNRTKEYSQNKVNEIVDNYDPRKLDPIDVWVNPEDGKTYILEGHSRAEALKRLGEKTTNIRYYEGSLEEAIDYAETKNDSKESHSLIEKATILQNRVERENLNKGNKIKEAKKLYGKDANTILALSVLNPKGKAVSTIDAFSSTDEVSHQDVITMGKWVGEIRIKYPELTNSHENEIFENLKDNFRKTEKYKSSLAFQGFIDTAMGRASFMGEFDSSKPLNLKNLRSLSPTEVQYNEELKEAESNLAKSKKTLDKARKDAVASGVENVEQQIKSLSNDVAYYEKELLEVKKREGLVQNQAKNEIGLFEKIDNVKEVLNSEGISNEEIIQEQDSDANNVKSVKESREATEEGESQEKEVAPTLEERVKQVLTEDQMVNIDYAPINQKTGLPVKAFQIDPKKPLTVKQVVSRINKLNNYIGEKESAFEPNWDLISEAEEGMTEARTLLEKDFNLYYDELSKTLSDYSSESEDSPRIKFQLSAFHGSPHTFDKFSLKALGSGEGRQAFGWGLYFTNIEDVAKHYASTTTLQKDGIRISTGSEHNLIKGRRNLYKVSLHKGKKVEDYDYIWHSRELTREQDQKVKNYLDTIDPAIYEYINRDGRYFNATGGGFYRELQKWIENNRTKLNKVFGDPKIWNRTDELASLMLLEAGIDGIKFIAGGVGSPATGTTNYVVFDENAITIDQHIKFQRSIFEDAKKQTKANLKPTLKKKNLPYVGITEEIATSSLSQLEKDFKSEFGIDKAKLRLSSPENTTDHQATIELAKTLGQRVIFLDSNIGGQLQFNALTNRGKLFINTNGDPTHSKFFSFGHELTHKLETESPELFDKLWDVIHEESIDVNGVLHDYARRYPELANNKDELFREYIGDVMGDAMRDRSFWTKVYQKSPELFKKMVDLINKILKTLKFNRAYETRQFIKDMDRVIEVSSSVLAEYGNQKKKFNKRIPVDMFYPKSSRSVAFQKAIDDKDLYVLHNLNDQNFRFADEKGGLANPSIAIVNKDSNFENFGEITLIARKDLIDPRKGAKTFGSDIYSPRYPENIARFRKGESDEFEKDLLDSAKKIGLHKKNYKHYLYDENEKNDLLRIIRNEYNGNPLLMAHFIAKNRLISKYKKYKKENPISSKLYPDSEERKNLRTFIDNNELRSKMNRYLRDYAKSFSIEEKILKGYTHLGYKQYIDYTLPNVLKKLKRDLRGGEKTAGTPLGKIRSKVSPQFKSIKQIKGNKNRLLNKDKFKKIKNDFDQKFVNLSDNLRKYSRWSGNDFEYLNYFGNALMDISSGYPINNYFKDLSDENKEKLKEFFNELRSMPTEYFESKPNRIVKLSEFEKAIIPKYLEKDILDIFKKNNIETFVYDENKIDDRKNVRNQIKDIRFQKRLKKDQTKTKAFKDWFGNSKVVGEQGKPLVVYHGTTQDFDIFDIEKSNLESDLGGGFYFTNNVKDVNRNYGNIKGADLRNKIERIAEQNDEYGQDQRGDEKIIKEIEKDLAPNKGNVIPAYLSMQNPVDLSERGTYIEPPYIYNEETDDYEDDYDSIGYKIMNAIEMNSFTEWKDTQKIMGTVNELLFEGMYAKDLIAEMKKIDEVAYMEGENGDLGGNEFIGDVFKFAGFDGFIVPDANKRFNNMGMEEGTTHYIVFKPTQIKSSIGNRGTFDKRDSDIRFQKTRRNQKESFVNEMSKIYFELGRKVTPKGAKVLPSKADFVKHLNTFDEYNAKDVKKASMLYNQIKNFAPKVYPKPLMLEDKVDKLEEKQVDLGKKLTKAGISKSEKKEIRDSIKKIQSQIKNIIAGATIGAKDQTRNLEDVKKEIREYAGKNLPSVLTKGQIKPLLTLIEKAKTLEDISKGIERVDIIAEKVFRKVLLDRIVNIVKSFKPTKTKDGKLLGKFKDGKIQDRLDIITRYIGLKADDVITERDELSGSIMNLESKQLKGDLDNKSLANLETYREQMYLLDSFTNIGNKSLPELQDSYTNLNQILKNAQTTRKIKTLIRKKELKDVNKKVIDVILGKGGKLLGRLRRRNTKYDDTTFLSKFIDGLKGANAFIQSWETLLDILSVKDKSSGSFKSYLNKRFGYMLRQADLEEQEGNRVQEETLSKKALEIYGLKDNIRGRYRLQKILEKNETASLVNITIQNKVLPPRFTRTGIRKNKISESNVKAVIKNNTITQLKLSQDELAQYWMWSQDETLLPTFKDMGFTETSFKQLEEALDPKVKEYAEFLLNDFYPNYYPSINKVYREMFYMNMPFNSKYSHVSREVYGQEIDTGETLKSREGFASAHSPHLIARVSSKRHLSPTSMINNVYGHIYQMEHFKSHAKPIRDIRATFNNDNIRNAIEQEYGKPFLRQLDTMIDKIARGGSDPKNIIPLIDTIIGNFVKAKIGLKPVIFLKQLASIPASMVEIPHMQFLKELGLIGYKPFQSIKPLLKSRLVQSRGKGFSRDVRQVLLKMNSQKLSNRMGYKDIMMLLARWGDKGAILFGGVPVYNYHYKKQMAKHGDKKIADLYALEKFEESAEKWQQSGQVKNLSNLQTHGSLMKLFTMFLNSPIQYMQQGQTGIRNLIARRGSDKENVKRTVMAYFILQATFNFISVALRGALDDDDDKKFWYKLSLSWTRGIPVLGGILEWLSFSQFQHQLSPIESVLPETKQGLVASKSIIEQLSGKEEFTDAELRNMAIDVGTMIGTFAGVPIEGLSEVGMGVYEVRQGVALDPVLRMLGYSHYSLYGGKNGQVEYIIKNNIEKDLGTRKLKADIKKWYEFNGFDKKEIKSKLKADMKMYKIRKEFQYNTKFASRLLKKGLSNKKKVEILKEAREEMGSERFNKFRRKARMKKLISKDLNKEYSKSLRK